MIRTYLAIWGTVLVVAVAPVLAVASCRPGTSGVASSSDDALCSHLAALGCKTGQDSSCPAALARLRTLGPIPDTCASKATSAEAVRACGLECAP